MVREASSTFAGSGSECGSPATGPSGGVSTELVVGRDDVVTSVDGAAVDGGVLSCSVVPASGVLTAVVPTTVDAVPATLPRTSTNAEIAPISSTAAAAAAITIVRRRDVGSG